MTIKGSIAGETQPCAFADATANTAWNTAFGSAVPAGSSWPWSQVTSLTSWRGSKAGCLVGGTVSAGSCASTGVTGTPVAALAAVTLNRWRSLNNPPSAGAPQPVVFCTLSTVSHSFVNVGELQACPATSRQCGDHCYTVPSGWDTAKKHNCPYNIWQLNSTTPTNNVLSGTWKNEVPLDVWKTSNGAPTSPADVSFSVWSQRKLEGKANVNLADAVGLDVTWYNGPCENPKNAWVSPPQDYPLMKSAGAGCSLGLD